MGFNGKVYKCTIAEYLYKSNSIYISAKKYIFKKKFNNNDDDVYWHIKEQMICELHFERKFKNENSR